MAASGQEPDDWSSTLNGCGSAGTDVGFALSRYVQGTINVAFVAPSSPISESDTHSRLLEEDSDPWSDDESLSEIPRIRLH